jgi:hypothetical protein
MRGYSGCKYVDARELEEPPIVLPILISETEEPSDLFPISDVAGALEERAQFLPLASELVTSKF